MMCARLDDTQYESDEITSPPARLTRPRKVTGFTESLMKRTLPSPIKTLMPPGWNDTSSSLLPAWQPWQR